jgi:hypothetical protein
MPERSEVAFTAVVVEHLVATPAVFLDLGGRSEQQTLLGCICSPDKQACVRTGNSGLAELSAERLGSTNIEKSSDSHPTYVALMWG